MKDEDRSKEQLVQDLVALRQRVKELEKALEQRKETDEDFLHLAAIVESSDDAIIGKTLEGIITSWNTGAEDIYGYSADEVIGRPISILIPPGQHNEAPEITDRIKRGARVDHYETVRKRKDGTQIAVSLTVSPIKDASGAIIGASTIARDITERKQSEKELRETRDYLNNLLDYANAPIIVWDRAFTIARFNHAFEHLTGRKASEIVGKPLDILFPDNRREEAMSHIRRTLSGERWEAVEIPILHRDGEVHIVLWNSATLYEEDSTTPIATIAQGQDITDRKRTEETLKRTIEKLERSNAELEQFAYVASHDLQEPLRMISSYTQLLARRYHGKLDSDADEFIEYAVDGANRMQMLINDLLTYSRVTTRGKPFAPINCEIIFEQELQNLQAAIADSAAEITHDPLPTVTADASQLGQLFQNLIGNAIKFRSDAPVRVHISAAQKDNEWIFSVRDNGIGIDPKFANRIFTVFQRLHNRKEYPGTGIGLAICKKIVERHGGRIWVESQPGAGATFFVTIPIQGDKQP